jgi:hypothetical protein
MTKALLAVGAATVALTAMPAGAQRYTNIRQCVRYHHGRCVEWRRLTRRQARRQGYRVGYNFGPNYSYVDIGSLPPPIVSRYHLRPTFRYVNRDGYVYVVNPNTYRVVRVISVP